jgi:hypothetical protein
MSACLECGAPIEQPKTGRPKTYCSNSCSAAVRKRKQRATDTHSRDRVKRVLGMTATESKVRHVWNDDRLRADWWIAIRKFKPILKELAASMPMPVELSGRTGWYGTVQVEVFGGRSASVERFIGGSVVGTIMWCALAELVCEHGPEALTPKMVRGRVKARLRDARRESGDMVRVQVKQPDGSVKYENQRLSHALKNSRPYLLDNVNPRAPHPAEARARADRAEAFKKLTGIDRFVWAMLVYTYQSPEELAAMCTHPGMSPRLNMTLEQAAEGIRQVLFLDAPDRDGDGGFDPRKKDRVDAVVEVLSYGVDRSAWRQGWRLEREVAEKFVQGALERMSELTGQTHEELLAGISGEPWRDLISLREANKTSPHPGSDGAGEAFGLANLRAIRQQALG